MMKKRNRKRGNSLTLFVTFPPTTASAERGFSKMKVIKSSLRSIQNQDRLIYPNFLNINHGVIEKIRAEEKFYNQVYDKFMNSKINFSTFLWDRNSRAPDICVYLSMESIIWFKCTKYGHSIWYMSCFHMEFYRIRSNTRQKTAIHNFSSPSHLERSVEKIMKEQY